MSHVIDNICNLFQSPTSTPPRGEVGIIDQASQFMDWNLNPDTVVDRKGLREYDRMRKQDEDVKNAMLLKIHAVLAPDGEIVLDVDEPTPIDEKNLELHNEIIKRLPGSFISNIKQMMTALYFGFSVTEKVWGQIPSGEFATFWGLNALKTKEPFDYQFDTDKFGNIEKDGLVLTNTQTTPELRLDPTKFVIYSYDNEFSNHYGNSDLRAAYRSYLSKDIIIRIMNKSIDKFALPPIIVEHAPQSSNSAARDIFKKLQANTVITHELGAYVVKLLETAKNPGDVFLKILDYYGRGISRAILIPDRVISEGGANSAGSFAQAKVHFDSFLWIINMLRTEIEDLLQEQLFKDITFFNFPEGTAVPRWRFNPLTESQKIDMLEIFMGLVDKGIIRANTEDANIARERLGFPPEEEGREDDTPDTSPEPARKPNQSTDKTKDADDVPEAPGDGENNSAEFVRRTTKTKYEESMDFQAINDGLVEIGTGSTEQLQTILTDQRNALTGQVKRKLETGGADTSYIANINVRFTPDLKKSMKAMVSDGYDQGKQDGRKNINKSNFLTVQPGTEVLPSAAITYLESKANFLVSGINGDIVEGTQALLIDALRNGEAVNVTIKKIQDLYLPYLSDGNIIIDQKQLTDYRLEAITRTHINEAYNEGRRAIGEDPDLEGFVIGYQFSEILDDRTVAISRFVDGKIIPINHPSLPQLTYPLHWNERGLFTYVTKDDGPVTFMSEGEIAQAISMKGYP